MISDWELSSPWLGFPGFPPRLCPLPDWVGRPRCPTHNPDPLRPIFDLPVIVIYTWAMCSTPHELFCLHSLTNGNIAGVLSWVSHFTSGVVLSADGFPTGFSRITSLPVRTPGQGTPPSTPTPSDHYFAHPLLYRLYTWAAGQSDRSNVTRKHTRAHVQIQLLLLDSQPKATVKCLYLYLPKFWLRTVWLFLLFKSI